MKNFIDKVKRSWLTKTTITIIIVLIFIAAFVALNLWVRSLNLSSLDLTPQKLFSVSEESKEQIEKIEKEVVMYFLGYKEDTSIVDLAKKYAKINEKIKVEVVDLQSRPDLQNKYGITADTQVVVIESGERNKMLTSSDFYTYDYTTYEQLDVTEQKLTNGILEVTINEKPDIYFLRNHGEYSLEYASTQKTMTILSAYITNDINNVNGLDLLSEEKVPENCNVLVIASPTKDFSDIETTKIMEYIDRGGKILWLGDPNFSGEEMKNAQSILAEYGVSLPTGIVLETDSSKMAFQNPEFIIPTVQSHKVTQHLDTDGGVMLMDAGKIDLVEEEKQTQLLLTVNELLKSSEKSFFRTDLTNMSTTPKEGEEKGEFLLGAEIKKKVKEDKESTMIVFANALFASDLRITSGENYINAVMVYNNKDLILNSISYLNEREDMITIRKNTGTVTYTATQQEDTIIRIIIFSVPAVIILIGIIVWILRRRKK